MVTKKPVAGKPAPAKKKVIGVVMTPVSSSNLKSVGYDAENKKLYIDFKTALGKKSSYVYLGVPQDVYDDLMSAPSKGHFLYTDIKFNYDYQKLS